MISRFRLCTEKIPAAGFVSTRNLDGDNPRHRLNGNLALSTVDRGEGLRRVGAAAKLFVDAVYIAIVAFRSSP